MNKTKIVATIGPASQDKQILKQMILAGLDVIRINMSYADYDFCDDVITKLNQLNEELNTNVAIMMDLNGPTIVVNQLKKKTVELKEGQIVEVYTDERVGDETFFSISYQSLVQELKYNSHLILGDNEVVLKIVDKREDVLTCVVEKSGVLKAGMKVISPDCKLNLHFLKILYILEQSLMQYYQVLYT